MAIDFPGLSPASSAGNRGKVSDQQSSTSSGAAGQPATTPERGERADTVRISDTAQALQRSSVDSSDNGGVDSDRVARIRAAIEDGSYQINNERIADSMLELDSLLGE